MLNKYEIDVLRTLAHRYAEIAALPVHEAKRKLWIAHNEFRTARPMVLIDQVCWNEMNRDGSLNSKVEDPYWRAVEIGLREKIFSWEHMPADMVLNPYISLAKPLCNSGWGMDAQVETLETSAGSVRSQHFKNLLEEEEDIEKIQFPHIWLDEEMDRQIRETADEIFAGIIPYRMEGLTMHLGIWDVISQWMGVENCYIELMDRPEFMHAIVEKMTQGLLNQIEDVNRIGGYDVTSNIVHCSQNFLDNLPGECDLEHGTTKNGWAFGLAQLFSSASPQITEEFEVEYMKRVFPHFGAIYYGCCERLDDRLDILAKLPNVRKISCSPWSDKDRFAERLPEQKIMSVKPNPAFLAGAALDEDSVRRELRHAIDAAKRNQRNVELILKDISTVRYEPQRLFRWADIAMEEVQR